MTTGSASSSGAPSSGSARMNIGQVLEQLRPDFPGVTIPKIRFLEDKGLIKPERTPAGYRKFSADDVTRLRYVLRMQRETLLFERGELVGRAALIVAAVRSFDRAAAPFEDLRKRQHSRAADAAEEEGAGKQFVWSGHIAHAGAAIELCRPTQAR